MHHLVVLGQQQQQDDDTNWLQMLCSTSLNFHYFQLLGHDHDFAHVAHVGVVNSVGVSSYLWWFVIEGLIMTSDFIVVTVRGQQQQLGTFYQLQQSRDGPKTTTATWEAWMILTVGPDQTTHNQSRIQSKRPRDFVAKIGWDLENNQTNWVGVWTFQCQIQPPQVADN